MKFPGPTRPPTGAGSAFTAVESEGNTRIVWGYTVGAGIDIMLLPGLFARAEYEFLQLNDVLNNAADVNSVRVGIGAKF